MLSACSRWSQFLRIVARAIVEVGRRSGCAQKAVGLVTGATLWSCANVMQHNDTRKHRRYMENSTTQKLLDALSRADDLSREDRAARIEWLAQYSARPGVVMGEMALMHMLEEARLCFISGHFIGALLLATSVVEQTLSEELENVVAPKDRRTLELMIKSAQDHLSFPDDLLSRTDCVRKLRNPFTHRKAPDHPHSFDTRFLSSTMHPVVILEDDAKLAMGVMYEWFR